MNENSDIELPFNIDYTPLIGTTRDQRDAMFEAAIMELSRGASEEDRETMRLHLNAMRNPNSGLNSSIETSDGEQDPVAAAHIATILSIIFYELMERDKS